MAQRTIKSYREALILGRLGAVPLEDLEAEVQDEHVARVEHAAREGRLLHHRLLVAAAVVQARLVLGRLHAIEAALHAAVHRAAGEGRARAHTISLSLSQVTQQQLGELLINLQQENVCSV